MTERRPGRAEHGPVFWIGLVVGWAVMAFGLWTLFRRAEATRPTSFATLFVGLVLVHDLVLAPLVTAIVAWAGPRLAPPARAKVTAAVIVSGALVLVSLPPLLGGRVPDDPSLLPRNYPVGLAIALVSVWAATGALVLVRRLRRLR